MTGVIQPADPTKSPERLLVEAERRIKKLEAKAAGQKGTIRDLRSRIRQDSNLTEQISELRSQLGELKGELKEITRANHEYVARYEALCAEMGKSRIDACRSVRMEPSSKQSAKSNLRAASA